MLFRLYESDTNYQYPLSSGGIQYAWRELCRRIGIEVTRASYLEYESKEVVVQYGLPSDANGVRDGSLAAILIARAPDSAWESLMECSPKSLDWLPLPHVLPPGAKPWETRIPALFWGEPVGGSPLPFAERFESGQLVFHVDILASIFFMLSRWEEGVTGPTDQHGRFPAANSVAAKQNFIDRPIVDEYALIFRAWLQVLEPELAFTPPRFAVKLSHDIDSVHRFVSPTHAVKTLGADLLVRRSISQAFETVRMSLDAVIDRWRPYTVDIDQLAAISEANGFTSSFYFMAALPSRYDNGYDLANPMLRRCIDSLRARGHEIGFHPGYTTFDNPEVLAAEMQRCTAALGQAPTAGRQHYLRFRAPDTWLQWEKVGLACDSTVGYAEQEGFRCGTCHPYHPYDWRTDRELDVLEIPLIVMDQTLVRYRSLTPAAAHARALHLATLCQKVNGTFSLLWHNTSLRNGWDAWGAMYRRLVADLAALQ
jgi:hypothetical protein